MRRGRSVSLRRLLVVVALLSLSAVAYGLAAGNDTKRPRPCNSSDADVSCGENQRCMEEKKNERIEGVCQCLQGYEFAEDDECRPSVSQIPVNSPTVKPDQTEESGGSSVAGLLIPTFLIIIAVVLYFGARRYRWVQRFRQYRQNYGNVLVTRDDDDDDDPPIA